MIKQLNEFTWPDFASTVAAPSAPDDYCTAAITRLMTHLLDYIVDIKGLRPQFHPHNKIELIKFRTPEEAQEYANALADYQKEKNRIESDDTVAEGSRTMHILAQFTVLRKKAELIRAHEIANRMYSQVQDRYAAAAACCFKTTISKVVQILIEDFGVRRSDISLIWGGLPKKVKARRKKIDNMSAFQQQSMRQSLEESGMDSTDALELMNSMTEMVEEQHADSGVMEAYRLGNQNARQRQEEIDRYQSGKSLYCLFTFKAGGVGLSLHHSDEHFPELQCRKKPHSDYVMEEDIARIPVRPRKTTLTPVYSAVEMVQGLGRIPRLTSLSDSEQTMLFYDNTIEVPVAHSVGTKLKCLKRVVRNKEHWEDIIMHPEKLESEGHAKDNALVDTQQTINNKLKSSEPNNSIDTSDADDDDDVFLGDGDDD